MGGFTLARLTPPRRACSASRHERLSDLELWLPLERVVHVVRSLPVKAELQALSYAILLQHSAAPLPLLLAFSVLSNGRPHFPFLLLSLAALFILSPCLGPKAISVLRCAAVRPKSHLHPPA